MPGRILYYPNIGKVGRRDKSGTEFSRFGYAGTSRTCPLSAENRRGPKKMPVPDTLIAYIFVTCIPMLRDAARPVVGKRCAPRIYIQTVNQPTDPMKRLSVFLILACAVAALPAFASKKSRGAASDYVVMASYDVKSDAAWMAVVEALQAKHRAEVIFYDEAPRGQLEALRRLAPRYVAVVEMPENLDRDYVIDLSKLSREVDDDIYADFLWGIVTGYDAAAAMRMVENSTEPLVVRDAVATIMELNSAKWFDRYGWVDDHTRGLWGEKRAADAEVVTAKIAPEQVLPKFMELYAGYDPDLVVTAAHATERNLEMPFSLGFIIPEDGHLIGSRSLSAVDKIGELRSSGKRKVYFAVGNCLIGNVNNTRNSMAITWMNDADAATMIGYVVTTWHGRNGWGGLKYWLTVPGRYTLAEAIYMNQQDMLYQMNEWSPSMLREDYPRYDGREFAEASARLGEMLGGRPSHDQVGFWHDRDVLAYYGDPKWDVRLQRIERENDFDVDFKVRGRKCVITITTHDDFNLERMKGDHFKEEHVLDLPFSYFFPERLKNPRLAEGQEWKAAVDENFLLIYDCDFEPGSKYEVRLDIER